MMSDLKSPLEIYAEKQTKMFTLFHRNSFAETEGLCTELISVFPAEAEPYHILGIIHAQNNNLSQAIELLRLAVKLSPENISYKINLANVYHEDKNYIDALYCLDEVLKKSPYEVSALDIRGVVLKDMGKLDEAEQVLVLALNKSPRNLQVHFNLACVYQKNDSSEKAKLIYEKILDDVGFHFKSLANLAEIYEKEKNIEYAEKLYVDAISIAPKIDLELLNFNLGTLYHGIKKWDKALHYIEETLFINSENANAINYLSVIRWEQGEIFFSLKKIESLVLKEPAFHKAQMNYCQISQSTQNLDYWSSSIDGVLASNKSPVIDVLKLHVERAVLAWLDNALISCADELNLSIDLMDDRTKLTLNARAYRHFLSELVDFRQLHARLYEHECRSQLYFIGDSHCLSANGLKASKGGVDYQIQSFLVIGAKAWHLSREENNRFKASVKCAIDKVEEGACVIFGFGEIDCRVNEGIFPYFLKHHNEHGCSVEQNILQLVGDYVDFVVSEAKRKSIDVVFYGVPACVLTPIVKTLDASDREIYLNVIEQYNKSLKYFSAKIDAVFLDVYSMTIGDSGFAKSGVHIDDRHLSPHVLNDIFSSKFK